ncbi:MAG: hypothetical protein ACU83V_05525 [Gammaproteobacteria bacterium]
MALKLHLINTKRATNHYRFYHTAFLKGHMKHTALTKTALFTLAAGALAASQGVSAHTSFTTGSTVEGSGAVYTSAVIGGGCPEVLDDDGHAVGSKNRPVIASSMVFPDGIDSLIYVIHDGEKFTRGVTTPLANAKVADYISWSGIRHIMSGDAFKKTAPKRDRNGKNVVASYSWKGKIPGNDYNVLVPLRVNNATLVHDKQGACVKQVTFRPAIAHICKITDQSKMNDGTVRRWTPAVPNSQFSANSSSHDYDGATTFVVKRDLDKYPLDAACGNGDEVIIEPSAAQINNDLPIPRVWPK